MALATVLATGVLTCLGLYTREAWRGSRTYQALSRVFGRAVGWTAVFAIGASLGRAAPEIAGPVVLTATIGTLCFYLVGEVARLIAERKD